METTFVVDIVGRLSYLDYDDVFKQTLQIQCDFPEITGSLRDSIAHYIGIHGSPPMNVIWVEHHITDQGRTQKIQLRTNVSTAPSKPFGKKKRQAARLELIQTCQKRVNEYVAKGWEPDNEKEE